MRSREMNAGPGARRRASEGHCATRQNSNPRKSHTASHPMNAPTQSHLSKIVMSEPAHASTDLWIERTRSLGSPRFRLFCFPYAGGSAAMFREWAGELALNVEVCAIRLPGRERRYSEPALRRTEQVVESMLPILQHDLDLPFVMFGYSMGALLAYEVARGLLATCAVEPRALVVSAHSAPQFPMRRR